MEDGAGYMNSAQAARYIGGISEDTLRVWVNDGVIPAYRPGGKVLLFRREDIDAALASRVVKSKTEAGGVS